MKSALLGHRAVLGLVSIAAMPFLLGLPAEWPASEAGYWITRLALAVLAFGGAAATWGSPYWKIVYREAPLRRALTGISDLDERELALRDRANGLTYNLFVAATMILLLGVGAAADLGWIELSGDILIRAIIPYAYFAAMLPVIMLEWFEPSGFAPASLEEEEE